MFLKKRPYIVAELNSSHRGKIDIAKKMIDAAKDCGCDAVKFQSWTPESLYCRNYYEENPISKRMVKSFSLSAENLYKLSEYCKEKEIDFSSTPYSFEEVDFLVDKCDAPFVKIASMDINNYPFLSYIASKKVPIVLSTGMATIEEIKKAISVIKQISDEEICILHCVSVYPVEAQNVNLRNMIMLKDEFPEYGIGYSDHSLGNEIACAAVALGASLIEKHFTLDSSLIGWDNQMATEPEEMKALTSACRKVYDSLGSYNRIVDVKELEQRKKMRRSIVASRDLCKGTVLEYSDIDAKRPGTGISVSEIDSIVGKKVTKSIKKDELLTRENLE